MAVIRKPLAPLPDFTPLRFSPELVRILDDVRFGPLSDSDEYAEFCWFLREYPRIYRHHFDHAEYRLHSIRSAYEYHHAKAAEKLASEKDPNNFAGSAHYSRPGQPYATFAIYWDFESFLQSVGTSLDIATRVIGTTFREDISPNFNQFCKKGPAGRIKDIFLATQSRWVTKMKAYRDCFTHYTPVDTILSVVLKEYSDAWEVRCKLPVNPESREILRFRYSRRVELLRYAIRTYKNLVSFDRAVAEEISRLYRAGEYPKKCTNLFRLGKSRDEEGANG